MTDRCKEEDLKIGNRFKCHYHSWLDPFYGREAEIIRFDESNTGFWLLWLDTRDKGFWRTEDILQHFELVSKPVAVIQASVVSVQMSELSSLDDSKRELQFFTTSSHPDQCPCGGTRGVCPYHQ